MRIYVLILSLLVFVSATDAAMAREADIKIRTLIRKGRVVNDEFSGTFCKDALRNAKNSDACSCAFNIEYPELEATDLYVAMADKINATIVTDFVDARKDLYCQSDSGLGLIDTKYEIKNLKNNVLSIMFTKSIIASIANAVTSEHAVYNFNMLTGDVLDLKSLVKLEQYTQFNEAIYNELSRQLEERKLSSVLPENIEDFDVFNSGYDARYIYYYSDKGIIFQFEPIFVTNDPTTLFEVVIPKKYLMDVVA